MKLQFSRHILEKYPISNFMKICSVGAELYHAVGRTDMAKLIITFRNFTNAPKTSKEGHLFFLSLFFLVSITYNKTTLDRPISCISNPFNDNVSPANARSFKRYFLT